MEAVREYRELLWCVFGLRGLLWIIEVLHSKVLVFIGVSSLRFWHFCVRYLIEFGDLGSAGFGSIGSAFNLV